MSERAKELLQSGIDIHIHSAPSHYPRIMDDFELCAELDRYEMAGAVIKSHFGATVERACVANRHSGSRAKLYGGVALNLSAGGLNPYAARAQLALGAAMVWMPTLNAKAYQEKVGAQNCPLQGPGIEITDEKGRLKAEIYEIMDIVRSYSRVLCTGHISSAEAELLCREGVDRGVRILLTHPDNSKTFIPVERQAELAGLGVYIEKCWNNILSGSVSAEEMARRIKIISAEMCVMSTDTGQAANGSPMAAFEKFIDAMLQNDIKSSEIRRMAAQNPADLLK